jgi:hypothetical protein
MKKNYPSVSKLKIMSQSIQVSTYQTLNNFMQGAPNFENQTKKEIEAFFAYCTAGMESNSEKLLATLFIKALNKRIHSEFISENIYLGKFETSQIQLFDILIEKFPFVKYSQYITNKAILEEMKGCEEVTLFDIGIGLGTQIINVIEQAKELPNLRRLHVLGIEPYGDALAVAERNILALNQEVPFEIHFTGIHDFVEQVDFASIQQTKGKLIVNASLALHHIQSDQHRMDIIAKVKAMNPSAFILIEPNVNHYETDFHKRFQNCYRHFHHIFQVIDRIEDISNDDKNALKLFFGREIEDIIGKEDKDRFEKHEPATHWIGRLKESNFSIKNDFLSSPIEAGCGVEISYHPEGFLGFTHEDETVLAVIYAN